MIGCGWCWWWEGLWLEFKVFVGFVCVGLNGKGKKAMIKCKGGWDKCDGGGVVIEIIELNVKRVNLIHLLTTIHSFAQFPIFFNSSTSHLSSPQTSTLNTQHIITTHFLATPNQHQITNPFPKPPQNHPPPPHPYLPQHHHKATQYASNKGHSQGPNPSPT